MFERFKAGARDAFNAASKGVTDAASALKALAESLATRATQAADIGRLLDIFDKIPGVDFPTHELDAAYLDTVIAAFQMRELALIVTCTGPKTTDIDIRRIGKFSAQDADALVGAPKFSATVLTEGQEGRPSIQMLINKENLAQNYRHVSVDALVRGLMKPVENVPFVGGVLAAGLALVARPVAQFILGLIFNQAENIVRYTRGANAALPAPTEDTSELPAPVDDKPALPAPADDTPKPPSPPSV